MATQPQHPFQSLHLLTTLVICTIAVQLVIHPIVVAVDFLAMFLFPTWNDMSADPVRGELVVGLVLLALGLLSAVAFITAVVLVCMWMYRAAANIRALGATATISPGWAAGWWFVPIANLAMPYFALKEIYAGSHGASDASHKNNAAPGMLKLYWACWLIGNVTSTIETRLVMNPDPDVVLMASYVGVASLVLSVTSGLLLIRFVRQVRDAQQAAIQSDDALHQVCPRCRYDLRGSQAGLSCPECGQSLAMVDSW